MSNLFVQDVQVVTDARVQILSHNTARQNMRLKNVGTEIIYIGDSSLTASNGFPLYPNATFKDDIFLGDLYAICDSTKTSTLKFVEE